MSDNRRDGGINEVERAIMSASEATRDFATSDVASRLSPSQLLVALTLAAVGRAESLGLPPAAVAAKLREIADALEAK